MDSRFLMNISYQCVMVIVKHLVANPSMQSGQIIFGRSWIATGITDLGNLHVLSHTILLRLKTEYEWNQILKTWAI